MSAVMPEQPSNNVAEFFAPGPGERLRATRLSMGLDLPKIASELHLSGRVVEALEADDYTDIGARVFVRGYLRNYARIVGMPFESILRQFDEKWPDDDVRHSIVRQSPRLPADGGVGRGWAGVISWLLAIGLLVLFLMWWRGYLDAIVPEQIRSTGAVDESRGAEFGEPNGDAAFPSYNATVPADGSLRLPAPPPDVAPEIESPSVTPLPGPLVDEPSTTFQAGEAAGGADLAKVSSALALSEPLPARAEGPAVEPVDAMFDDGGAPVIDATKQIVLTFNAACWVDVRDAERRFKLFGEMPKGTRRVLGGQPPYKLVIGNAHAVSISVNGRPFDLTPYAKGNVARFTLDP